MDALPVDPIASAASLGWHNVFKANKDNEERDKISLRHEAPPIKAPVKTTSITPSQPVRSSPSAVDGSNGGGTTDMYLQVQELESRIKDLWQELHVPPTDRAVFSRQYFYGAEYYDMRKAKSALLVEYLNLLRHRKDTVNVLRAIREREKCLSYLTAMFQTFRRGIKRFHKRQEDQKNFVLCLALVRDTSLVVIEAIMKWRKHMWRKKPFLWTPEPQMPPVNYLIKMASDADFLLSSSGLKLLEMVGLQDIDLMLLFPQVLQMRKQAGASLSLPSSAQEHDRKGYYQLFLQHSFEGENAKEFGDPTLARRQDAATKVRGASSWQEKNNKMMTMRMVLR